MELPQSIQIFLELLHNIWLLLDAEHTLYLYLYSEWMDLTPDVCKTYYYFKPETDHLYVYKLFIRQEVADQS